MAPHQHPINIQQQPKGGRALHEGETRAAQVRQRGRGLRESVGGGLIPTLRPARAADSRGGLGVAGQADPSAIENEAFSGIFKHITTWLKLFLHN